MLDDIYLRLDEYVSYKNKPLTYKLFQELVGMWRICAPDSTSKTLKSLEHLKDRQHQMLGVTLLPNAEILPAFKAVLDFYLEELDQHIEAGQGNTVSIQMLNAFRSTSTYACAIRAADQAGAESCIEQLRNIRNALNQMRYRLPDDQYLEVRLTLRALIEVQRDIDVEIKTQYRNYPDYLYYLQNNVPIHLEKYRNWKAARASLLLLVSSVIAAYQQALNTNQTVNFFNSFGNGHCIEARTDGVLSWAERSLQIQSGSSFKLKILNDVMGQLQPHLLRHFVLYNETPSALEQYQFFMSRCADRRFTRSGFSPGGRVTAWDMLRYMKVILMEEPEDILPGLLQSDLSLENMEACAALTLKAIAFVEEDERQPIWEAVFGSFQDGQGDSLVTFYCLLLRAAATADFLPAGITIIEGLLPVLQKMWLDNKIPENLSQPVSAEAKLYIEILLFAAKAGVAQGKSAIELAAKQGKWDAVKAFVETIKEQKLSANKEVYSHMLVHAVEQRNPEMIRFLLTNGAHACVVENNQTPMQIAANNKYWDCVEALSSKKAGKKDEERYGLALLNATKFNKSGIAQRLINAGASIINDWHSDETSTSGWYRVESGYQALHYAATNNDAAVVRALLSHGARPWERSKFGKSAIEVAARNGKWDAVKAFINTIEEKRIAVDQSIYLNVLSHAEEQNNAEVVRLLFMRSDMRTLSAKPDYSVKILSNYCLQRRKEPEYRGLMLFGRGFGSCRQIKLAAAQKIMDLIKDGFPGHIIVNKQHLLAMVEPRSRLNGLLKDILSPLVIQQLTCFLEKQKTISSDLRVSFSLQPDGAPTVRAVEELTPQSRLEGRRKYGFRQN